MAHADQDTWMAMEHAALDGDNGRFFRSCNNGAVLVSTSVYSKGDGTREIDAVDLLLACADFVFVEHVE